MVTELGGENLAERARQSEVCDFYETFRIEEYVARFVVSVYNIAGVHVAGSL